jgi:hypothetical protein
MDMTPEEARRWNWHRIWPALVTFALPVVFLLLIMERTVHYLVPADREIWPGLDPNVFLLDAFKRFAHDVEGRLLFGTASAFIRLASFGCCVLALWLLVRKFGWRAGAGIFVGSTTFGIAIGYWLTSENIIFFNFLYTPIQLAQNAGVVLPGTIDRLKCTIMLNMIVGIGACGALLAAFSAVAVRAELGNIDRSQQNRTRLAASSNVLQRRHGEVVRRPRWSSRQSLGGERNRGACLRGPARLLLRPGRYWLGRRSRDP